MLPPFTTALAAIAVFALTSALLWTASAYKDHVRKEFAGEIAALNTNIGKKDLAIELLGKTTESLKKTNAEHNAAIEAMEKSYAASIITTERELVAVRKKGKAGEARYAKLEAITAPFINITSMAPSAITAELSQCRRAVEINNAFTAQGEEK